MKLFALFTSLLVGVSLMAAEPVSKWTFSLNGSADFATSTSLKNLSNSYVGVGGGASVTYKLSPKQSVRLRSDYISWPTHNTSNTAVPTKPSLSQKGNLWATEADYLYSFKKNWYVEGGAGVGRWINQYHGYNSKVYGTKNYLLDSELVQPLVSVGVGYVLPGKLVYIKNITAEVRYISTQLAGSANAGFVQAGLNINF